MKRKGPLTVEQMETADVPEPAAPCTAAGNPSPGACPPADSGFLDGVPRQRRTTPAAAAGSARTSAVPTSATARAATPAVAPRSLPRPWRLLPTPAATPFTFVYVLVLAVTSAVTAQAGPAVVHALHQGSSTDVAHLVHAPVLVLLASALWIAGGITSTYALGLVLMLTALERRIGGPRAAGVFLLGHVLATLATEVPVGVAVLAGHLPASSLHRLDYGVSFGVAAATGALAGLLTPWLGRALLAFFGGALVLDLFAFTDPMTEWGHLIALATGVATWPFVRRPGRARTAGPAAGMNRP